MVEDIWQNRDRAYNIKALVRRLQRVNKEMSCDARDRFAAFVPDGDVGAFASQLPQMLTTQFANTMKVLRRRHA